MTVLQQLLTATITLATVFFFGSAGEIITQKSGHLNLGAPGIVALGGLGGAIGESFYVNSIGITANPNPFLAVLIAIMFSLLFGALGGLIFSFFTVSLRCNQNVVGLCLTTFGVAFTGFFFTNSSLLNFDRLADAAVYFKSMGFPGQVTSDLPFLVEVLFSHGFLTYFAILVCIVAGFIINRTKLGLAIRATGENPAAADSMGINVKRIRYGSTIVGSMITSLAGLQIVMVLAGGAGLAEMGSEMETLGWLALSIVIFSMWKPGFAIIGSLIFSFFYKLPQVITGLTATGEIALKMLPYILTIVVLIITSIIKVKSSKAPNALGTNYFREDR